MNTDDTLDDDFSDDDEEDVLMFPPSPVPNSGGIMFVCSYFSKVKGLAY